jgi:hypothetical protein
MLIELLNSFSVNTLANQFIDYTLLTVAFFSFFTLVDHFMAAKKEVNVKSGLISK